MQWKLEHFEYDPVFSEQSEIRDSNGRFICRIENCPSPTVARQWATDSVAGVQNEEWQLWKRNLANARLIAAAPEMLNALLDALPYVEDVLSDPVALACFKPGTVQRHAAAIRAAIARATGAA